LVDEFFKHLAAHGLYGLGRGARGVGAAEHLVDLVYRYFFGAHFGRYLGGDLFVVFVAAGGKTQCQGGGENGEGEPGF
jgi:hypothetical protein